MYLPTTLLSLLSSLLYPLPLPTQVDNTPASTATPITFRLRHQHGVALPSSGSTPTSPSRIILADINPSSSSFSALNADDFPPEFSIATRELTVPRRRSITNNNGETAQIVSWEDEPVPAPDITKRETLLQLAQMSSNDYYNVSDKAWYDLGERWNTTHPIGWTPTPLIPSPTSLRGYIFVSSDPDNSTIIISLKGTSVYLITDRGPTSKHDRINDNLLFSCCCARVGPTWTTACGCYAGSGRCDMECLGESVKGRGRGGEEEGYYNVAVELYNTVALLYPTSTIWLTGHSLGGGLASLVGATFGAPAVAFESPGEKMASQRLHLPSPPSTHHITHVYHTGDPIPMGTCTGVTSVCSIGGYALETRCHLGQVILYDTITHLKYSSNSRSHGIEFVIQHLLSEEGDWVKKFKNASEEVGSLSDDEERPGPGEVPRAREARFVEGGEEGECVDCYNWEFGLFLEKPYNFGVGARLDSDRCRN